MRYKFHSTPDFSTELSHNVESFPLALLLEVLYIPFDISKRAFIHERFTLLCLRTPTKDHGSPRVEKKKHLGL